MKTLYMKDSYLKEFNSIVESVNGKEIILQNTAFYPSSGGQPNDTGIIIKGSDEFKIVNVFKKNNQVIHEVDKEGINVGDEIRGVIDWQRRYALMKAHTAVHILCSILHSELGSLITGNQLYEDYFRVDFNLENYDRDVLEALVEKTNEIIAQNKPVSWYFLPKEEAFKIPGALKLANILPPDVEELRIVEIKDFDVQVDGGTHVRNTSEISRLKLLRTENKGKNNRRIVISFE